MQRDKQTEGFTLLELMVVISFLGILLAVALNKLAFMGTKTKVVMQQTIREMTAVAQAWEDYYSMHNADPTAVEDLVNAGLLDNPPTYTMEFATTPNRMVSIALSNLPIAADKYGLAGDIFCTVVGSPRAMIKWGDGTWYECGTQPASGNPTDLGVVVR